MLEIISLSHPLARSHPYIAHCVYVDCAMLSSASTHPCIYVERQHDTVAKSKDPDIFRVCFSVAHFVVRFSLSIVYSLLLLLLHAHCAQENEFPLKFSMYAKNIENETNT